jgi:hypothetical protein
MKGIVLDWIDRACVRRRSKVIIAALAVVLGLLTAAPVAFADAAHRAAAPTFKATRWRVWVADSTGYAQPHKAALGSTYTLCNMDRLAELEIDYGYKNAGGRHFTLMISGPGGPSEKTSITEKHAHGTAVFGWSSGALPGGQQPAETGSYVAAIRKGGKALMHATIKLASSNTCS